MNPNDLDRMTRNHGRSDIWKNWIEFGSTPEIESTLNQIDAKPFTNSIWRET